VSLEFFIDIKSFRSLYGPGVESASNRNEYQEHFLGGKGGRCVRLTTLPLSCTVFMKSGNLNFLEPSGPVMGLLYPYLYQSLRAILMYRHLCPSFPKWSFSSEVIEIQFCSYFSSPSPLTTPPPHPPLFRFPPPPVFKSFFLPPL